MKSNKRSFVALLAMAVALMGVGSVSAQDNGGRRGPGGQGGRGNFDPAEFQARIMERYREQLEITSDDEWTAISGLIENVNTARRDAAVSAFGGFGRRGGFGGPGGGRGGRGFGGEPDAEVTALQEAIDSGASAADIKAKLAKVQESRKKKEAALAKAQEELRSVLNVRQEAIATLNGLL